MINVWTTSEETVSACWNTCATVVMRAVRMTARNPASKIRRPLRERFKWIPPNLSVFKVDHSAGFVFFFLFHAVVVGCSAIRSLAMTEVLNNATDGSPLVWRVSSGYQSRSGRWLETRMTERRMIEIQTSMRQHCFYFFSSGSLFRALYSVATTTIEAIKIPARRKRTYASAFQRRNTHNYESCLRESFVAGRDCLISCV